MITINEFPSTGSFIHIEESSLGADSEVTVYDGIMDIQVSSAEINMVGQESNYMVYMPLILDDSGNFVNPIRKGDKFIGNCFGESISGRVQNSSPSLLGKLNVWIQRENW